MGDIVSKTFAEVIVNSVGQNILNVRIVSVYLEHDLVKVQCPLCRTFKFMKISLLERYVREDDPVACKLCNIGIKFPYQYNFNPVWKPYKNILSIAQDPSRPKLNTVRFLKWYCKCGENGLMDPRLFHNIVHLSRKKILFCYKCEPFVEPI